jgi:hypothetical protein
MIPAPPSMGVDSYFATYIEPVEWWIQNLIPIELVECGHRDLTSGT